MATAEIDERYWINVRDKPAFLRRMMMELSGDAEVSFEGDLSSFDFPAGLTDSSESESLRRATISPEMDFLRCPLTETSVASILKSLGSGREVVSEIIHIQISVSGTLEFGAYDQFHPDCVVTGARIPLEFLSELQDLGIIRSFEATKKEGEQVGAGDAEEVL